MNLNSSESGVVKACLEYLSVRGVWCWRSNNVPVFDPVKHRYRKFNGMMGVADILGMLPVSWCTWFAWDADKDGFTIMKLHEAVGATEEDYAMGRGRNAGSLLAIECKTESGRLSPDQKQFGREVLLRGGLYIVARSIDDLREAGL